MMRMFRRCVVCVLSNVRFRINLSRIFVFGNDLLSPLKRGKVPGVNMAKDIDDEVWRECWVNNQIRFHVPDVNELSDRGHIVVGAELSSIAIHDFFKENNVEYSSSPMSGLDDAELYTSNDSSILIYKANLFDLNREILGEFDCIWDRASLVALLRKDLQRYADLMKALLKPKGRCLLETLEYDQSKMNGPPFSTPLDQVEQLYAAWDIKFLEATDGLNDKWRSRGLNAFTSRTHLLTKEEK